jgi:hypothetical protein
MQVNNCGINAWTRNSRVIYAETTDLSLPFTRKGVIEGVFSHEPSIARAPNGSWVMYFVRALLDVDRVV